MWIAIRSRVEREREKIREHEREEKFIKIEENILNRVSIFVHRQMVYFLIPDEEHLVVFS